MLFCFDSKSGTKIRQFLVSVNRILMNCFCNSIKATALRALTALTALTPLRLPLEKWFLKNKPD